MEIKNKKKEFIGIILILILATFFRLYQLESLPAGLFPDEAANGEDALLILQGNHAPFFERGQGRESLYFYLLSISLSLLGTGYWQIHLVSAIIGILTVLATWLLAKELFGSKTASLTSFFLAISPWHTILSRTGFRAILVPLISTLFFYFSYLVFKQTKKKKRIIFAILAGASLGLGFYTYLAFRIMIGIIGLIGLIILIKQRKLIKQFGLEILIVILTSFLVLIPLTTYFIQNPEFFLGRAGAVSIFNPDLNQGDLLGTIFMVLQKTILMFFTQGDLNYRHNISGLPHLNVLVSPFFGLGIIYALFIGIKGFFQKNNPLKNYLKYLFLLIWFSAMLIPQVLTAEGIPHGLRVIGTIPVVFFFPTFLIVLIGEKLNLSSKISKIVFSGILGLILSTSLIYNYSLYFIVNANSPDSYYSYRSDLTIVSNYLNQRNLKQKTYLVLDEYSVQTPDFLTQNQPYQLLDPAKSYLVQPNPEDQVVFTESTIFDTKKFEQYHTQAEIVKQEFNQFNQEILRVYEF